MRAAKLLSTAGEVRHFALKNLVETFCNFFGVEISSKIVVKMQQLSLLDLQKGHYYVCLAKLLSTAWEVRHFC